MSYAYEHIMYDEYAEFLAKFEGGMDRISRSVTVPHFFTIQERRDLSKDFENRGLSLTGGTLKSIGWANPWVELVRGQQIISEEIQFETKKGRSYRVCIIREAIKDEDKKVIGFTETWTLRHDYSILLSGSKEDIISMMNSRKTLQLRKNS